MLRRVCVGAGGTGRLRDELGLQTDTPRMLQAALRNDRRERGAHQLSCDPIRRCEGERHRAGGRTRGHGGVHGDQVRVSGRAGLNRFGILLEFITYFELNSDIPVLRAGLKFGISSNSSSDPILSQSAMRILFCSSECRNTGDTYSLDWNAGYLGYSGMQICELTILLQRDRARYSLCRSRRVFLSPRSSWRLSELSARTPFQCLNINNHIRPARMASSPKDSNYSRRFQL